jgi:uncharacterized DUF497 family protein
VLFEWDERERDTNFTKHGVDFELAKLIFDDTILAFPDTRCDYGEVRIGAYGKVNGIVLFVVYTQRGECRRLISARKAGTEECKWYEARIRADEEALDER